jgi:uncharacterized Zn-binding protein involved in type VI secretion
MKRLIFGALSLLAATSTARAQSPAARVSDQTSHGGSIVGPGALTVRIGGQSAAVVGDFATCPLSTGTPPNDVPHVGGPIITGSATVLIGGRPAARVGDTISETGSFATVLTGAATVIIGP